jgi:hypothetical protein
MVLITSMPAAFVTTTKTAVVAIAIVFLLFAVYVCIIAFWALLVNRFCQLQLRVLLHSTADPAELSVVDIPQSHGQDNAG